MKKVLFIILINFSAYVANAQTVSIEEAISLINQNKDLAVKKIRTIGYVYKGIDLGSYKFSKDLVYATSDLTLAFEGNRCAAMSWTVSVLYASITMGDVLSSGFQVNEKATSGYTQAFKHFGKGLVLVLFDRSAYDNTIIVTLGRMAPNKLRSRKTETNSGRSNALKAMFSAPVSDDSNTSSLFQGTKRFSDENNAWSYIITIKEDSITLRLYPGKNNDYHKDKAKVREVIKGRIVNGKIVTKDPPEYLTNRFKFEERKLLEVNNEGGYNDYSECR